MKMILKSKIKHIPEFYKRYVDLIDDTDYFKLLKDNLEDTKRAFSNFENKPEYSYQKGKWTVLELLSHLVDVERILAYRAHAIARNERKELLGFNEDDYVMATDFKNKSIHKLLEEFEFLRKSNYLMFEQFSDLELSRVGRANNYTINVLDLAYIILGHAVHHLNVLKERYHD